MIWPGVEKLTLICGGRDIHESCELLGSQRMKELVEDESRYPERYVLFDVPPVFAGTASISRPMPTISSLWWKRAARKEPTFFTALDLLPREKIAGLVLNRQSRTSVQGYDYPYDNRQDRMIWVPHEPGHEGKRKR